ncbi:hypothetical protein QM012_000239 [Aureobasidium pullulans]|uniref:BZIP domain-containing protein n=1 Tax=Aureobasidium pullulans TaxID=5580 RepID=A0ABR0TVY7_AURPU
MPYMHITIKSIRIHSLYGRPSRRYAASITTRTLPVLMLSQYSYGYGQHTLAPPVGDTFTQARIMSSGHTTPAEPIVVDGHNGYAHLPPGHPAMYRNGIEVDYGQPVPPTVEFNVDELLEYQRRRSSATSEEKEPLTPAQRRRKAQNRAAQRAFRDRKRQRVQELEAQLSALEVRTNSLESDNERLRHELLRTQEENEVLRSIKQPPSPSHRLQPDRRRTAPTIDRTVMNLPAQ